jgi:type IV secretory pathway VirB4 component
MTMKDPPTATNADLLKPLREMDCECIIVTEWRAMPLQAARDFIQTKTSHFHRAKYVSNVFGSALGKLSGSKQEERPEDMQKDQSAAAMETQLGELLVDIEKNGTQLGEFAMTVILFDLDKGRVERSSAEVFKAMAKSGAVFYEEKHNTLAAWFAALPGGRKHQRRALYLTDRNYADMSMLFAPDTGSPWNERLNAECLSVMTTRQKSPIYLNTHYGDVGHMLFSGMIGSGKTFTVNYLLGEAIVRYNPRIVIFDISGANRSYFDLTQKANGAYAEIGLDRKFKINPWCLEPSRSNVHFQYSFVKVLVESRGYRMSGPEENLLYRVVRGCSRLRDVYARLECDERQRAGQEHRSAS